MYLWDIQKQTQMFALVINIIDTSLANPNLMRLTNTKIDQKFWEQKVVGLL